MNKRRQIYDSTACLTYCVVFMLLQAPSESKHQGRELSGWLNKLAEDSALGRGMRQEPLPFFNPNQPQAADTSRLMVAVPTLERLIKGIGAIAAEQAGFALHAIKRNNSEA